MTKGHLIEIVQALFAALGVGVSVWGFLVTWRVWRDCCCQDPVNKDDALNAWSMLRTETFNLIVQGLFLFAGIHALAHDPSVPHTPQGMLARYVLTAAAILLTIKSLKNRIDWSRIVDSAEKQRQEVQRRHEGKIRTRSGDTRG